MGTKTFRMTAGPSGFPAIQRSSIGIQAPSPALRRAGTGSGENSKDALVRVIPPL